MPSIVANGCLLDNQKQFTFWYAQNWQEIKVKIAQHFWLLFQFCFSMSKNPRKSVEILKCGQKRKGEYLILKFKHFLLQ